MRKRFEKEDLARSQLPHLKSKVKGGPGSPKRPWEGTKNRVVEKEKIASTNPKGTGERNANGRQIGKRVVNREKEDFLAKDVFPLGVRDRG